MRLCIRYTVRGPFLLVIYFASPSQFAGGGELRWPLYHSALSCRAVPRSRDMKRDRQRSAAPALSRAGLAGEQSQRDGANNSAKTVEENKGVLGVPQLVRPKASRSPRDASRPFIGSETWLVVPPPKEINEIWPPGKAGLAAVVLAWRGLQQRIAGEPSRGDSITSG